MAKYKFNRNFTAQKFAFERRIDESKKTFQIGDVVEASNMQDFARNNHLVTSDGFDLYGGAAVDPYTETTTKTENPIILNQTSPKAIQQKAGNGLIKWLIIAVVAYFLYKQFSK